MRITIFSMGSRGDVEPLLALASRFLAVGHHPVVVSSPDHAELAAHYGVDFAPFGPPLSSLMSEEVIELVESGDMIKLMRVTAAQRKEAVRAAIPETWRLGRDSDAVIFKGPAALFGYSIAEKLRVPCAEVQFFPVTPTHAFPPFLLGDGQRRSGLGDRMRWWAAERITWQFMQRATTNAQRRTVLDMPRISLSGVRRQQEREGMPLFYAYSPHVLPRPSDWPGRIHVTGYYPTSAPPEWSPPDGLRAFVEAGDPPVSFGLGSVPVAGKARLVEAFLTALERTGRRGILVSGWTGLGRDVDLPDHVHRVESVPYEWLFPRVAAAVHHGGAGTTAAGLRAGVPTVVTPVSGDQPSWGRRVAELGAGPDPIPIKQVDADRLTTAIETATTDGAMSDRARELGALLRAEDGVGRTVELFEQHVRRWRPPAR
ncbi:glycosyltransferase [Brachybacterium sp. YJGR34]|uniref:glycosyltransferase n=1 Tax=Brachybacterium sp. YJGR34 TaxID=2059911 RepID=UPI000E0B428D|nr:glycosyltransferase [Brachybacterium sp. YJGR34]